MTAGRNLYAIFMTTLSEPWREEPILKAQFREGAVFLSGELYAFSRDSASKSSYHFKSKKIFTFIPDNFKITHG